MAMLSWVVPGSSSLRPLTVISDGHTVDVLRSVRPLARRRRIRRIMVASTRAMAAMELIAVPAMATWG